MASTIVKTSTTYGTATYQYTELRINRYYTSVIITLYFCTDRKH